MKRKIVQPFKRRRREEEMSNSIHIHSKEIWKERNKRKKEKINEELVKFQYVVCL